MTSIATSHTAVEAGAELFVRHGDSWSYLLTGSFSATIQFESSNNAGASWDVIKTTTTTETLTEVKNEDSGGADIYVRSNCTIFGSGTAVATVADVDIALVGQSVGRKPDGSHVITFTEAGATVEDQLTIVGETFNRGQSFFKTATPETATDTASLTDAQMIGTLLVSTPTAAAAYTVRTGTQLLAALPADIVANDSFDLTIINLGGTGDNITLTVATDITIVGDPVVGPVADVATEQAGQGTFRFRYVTGTTFVAYRIS